MTLGLKRGTVALAAHDPAWELEAAHTIEQLRDAFGSAAKDIQHIGSTAIRHIKAKPIIDIAVAAECFASLPALLPRLALMGVEKSKGQPFPGIVLCSVDDPKTGVRMYNIQIVLDGSTEWKDHIAFRDYLNDTPEAAAAYENLKENLAAQYPGNLAAYSAGKHEFITECLKEARGSHVPGIF